MTEAELEAARLKYMGKLVRIMIFGRVASDNYGIGIVEHVRPSTVLPDRLDLTIRISPDETETWYIDACGYTAEIYEH